MRKFPLVIFFLLTAVHSFTQTDSIFAKIEITSVSINEHRSWIDTSIIITLEKFGHTDIISLGKIDSIEIGFQFELLKSYLGEKTIIMNGIAFFTKKDGKWQMHFNPTYRVPECKTVSNRSAISENDFGHAGLGMQDLQIEFKEVCYILKK